MSEPRIKDIISIVENFAPLSLQAEYDNCGLKIGDINEYCKGVLITLDTNEEVIKEAIKNRCNLIIEHHPLIFKPIYSIDYRLPLHKAIIKAIKNDIAIYSAHTNIDFVKNGLNDYFAKLLGLNDIECTNENLSSGRIGKLQKSMNLREFTQYAVDKTGDKNIVSIGDENMTINTVAVINGAGGGDTNYILELKEKNIDVFVTSEIKYSVARFAKDLNYGIISIGHYDSEIGFIDLIKNLIEKEKINIRIVPSEKCNNPYNNRR